MNISTPLSRVRGDQLRHKTTLLDRIPCCRKEFNDNDVIVMRSEIEGLYILKERGESQEGLFHISNGYPAPSTWRLAVFVVGFIKANIKVTFELMSSSEAVAYATVSATEARTLTATTCKSPLRAQKSRQTASLVRFHG
ncbi:hypothetical protein J6590_061019 [Homalodisca vitripennis]|nr:hypothetical protein J6590_061019 [Homalodisca vitripennis]